MSTIEEIRQANSKLLHTIHFVCLKNPELARVVYNLHPEVIRLFQKATYSEIELVSQRAEKFLGTVVQPSNDRLWMQIMDDINRNTEKRMSHTTYVVIQAITQRNTAESC